MRKLHKTVIASSLAALVILGSLTCLMLTRSVESELPRHHQWAIPIQKQGLENFYKVSDTLYRGAQPTADGFAQLKSMGIKTTINLRSFHSDKDEIGSLELACEQIRMEPFYIGEQDIIRFLRIVTSPEKTPVFVHCQHGSDRTGLMCAIYRVAVCGWSKEEAVDEMVNGGFGFHPVWKNIISYFMNMDIESVKQKSGIANK